MRRVFRFLLTAIILLGGWAAPLPRAVAASFSTTANHVFGQPDFMSNLANNGNANASANSLWQPYDVAVDMQGNLYVVDDDNNRVLEYNAPLTLTAGAPADRVFGQPGFTSRAANNGGISANSLNFPIGVAVDAQGNLYVADTNNNRVLEYDTPLTTDTTADRVFGQPDFSHNTANYGGLGANSLNFPFGVALDAQGHLYVVDSDNNRVLEYDTPLTLTAGAPATRVFGQPDFTHNAANNGALLPSTNSLYFPFGVAADAPGNLYVADYGNNRVLEYNAPLTLTAGAPADRVFGQPGFVSYTANNGGVSANSLWQPEGVAVDAPGNLYVADSSNSRVLEYNTPLTTDVTADHVFGQPDFVSNTANNGGLLPSANSLYGPSRVAVDVNNNLYVVDLANNRVLEYDWLGVTLYVPLVQR